MPVRVVCISRTLGSGGMPIAQVVAERLGFRYLDEEIIERAAAAAKLSADELLAAVRKPTVMKRLLDAIGMTPVDRASMGGLVRKPLDFEYYSLREPAAAPVEHIELVKQTIREVAEEGNAVIHAHASSIVLAERPDILRVLVTASEKVRLARVKEIDETASDDIVTKDDAGRVDYFRRFHRLDRELPTHYDLVINTDRFAPEKAVDLVVWAARA
jgi:cytidylate kinase